MGLKRDERASHGLSWCLASLHAAITIMVFPSAVYGDRGREEVDGRSMLPSQTVLVDAEWSRRDATGAVNEVERLRRHGEIVGIYAASSLLGGAAAFGGGWAVAENCSSGTCMGAALTLWSVGAGAMIFGFVAGIVSIVDLSKSKFLEGENKQRLARGHPQSSGPPSFSLTPAGVGFEF